MNIKSIFDAHGSELKWDKRIVKELRDYANRFVNSSEDHISFFGGHDIGVYPVKFKTSDRHEFLIDILGLEEGEIKSQVRQLDTVDESWVRGTDVMNLTCTWACHKFKNSSLGRNDMIEGMYLSMLILNFKFITSLMSHFFPHPVSPELSQIIYDRLSYKYSLKKEGSWMNLMKERANDIIDEKSVHYETIVKYVDDGDIQYMITDIQGRLRSIIKNLWEVIAEVREKDIKRHKLSYFSELEGEVVVKDMSNKYSAYRDYIIQTMASPQNELIKSELITVIGNLMPTMPAPVLGQALIEFHKQYNRKNKQVTQWLDLIIEHCFESVLARPEIAKKINNIPELLVYMRSLYTASKSKGDVEKMRSLGEAFIKKNVKNSNVSVIASTRTGLMLYILLRMFTKDHYG